MPARNFHCWTAAIARSFRPSPNPCATAISCTWPRASITARTITTPWSFALRASSLYSGSTLYSSTGSVSDPWKPPCPPIPPSCPGPAPAPFPGPTPVPSPSPMPPPFPGPAEGGPMTACGSPNTARFNCGTAISELATMLGSTVRIGFAFSAFTIGARNCLSFRGGRLPRLAAVLARIPPPPPGSSACGTVTSYLITSSGVNRIRWSVFFTGEVLTPVVSRTRTMAAPCSAPDIMVDRAGDAYMALYDADRPPVSNLLKLRAPCPCASCFRIILCAPRYSRVTEHLVPPPRRLLYAPRLSPCRRRPDWISLGTTMPLDFRHRGRPAHLAACRAPARARRGAQPSDRRGVGDRPGGFRRRRCARRLAVHAAPAQRRRCDRLARRRRHPTRHDGPCRLPGPRRIHRARSRLPRPRRQRRRHHHLRHPRGR